MVKFTASGLLSLLCWFSVASAQPVIHVATEHWPPNNYMLDNGKLGGVATKKVRQMFELANIKYKIALYPWARAYRVALTEPNAAIYSILRSKQREQQFQWVCPLVKPLPLYFIHLTKRKDIVLTQLSDAKQYQTATGRDEFDHQYLVRHGFTEKDHLQLTTDDETNTKMLLMERTDLIITSEQTVIENLALLGQSRDKVKLALMLKETKENPVCLAFSLKTDQSIVARMRDALIEINR